MMKNIGYVWPDFYGCLSGKIGISKTLTVQHVLIVSGRWNNRKMRENNPFN